MEDVLNAVNSLLEGKQKDICQKSVIAREFLALLEKQDSCKNIRASSKDWLHSREFERKTRELKRAELENDFCWLEYSSYKKLPPKFRELFKTLIDPLMFNGVNFRYSSFEKHQDALLHTLSEKSVLYVLKDSFNYTFIVIPYEGSYKHTIQIKHNKYREYIKWFNDNIIKGYHIQNGQIIKIQKAKLVGE